MVDMSMANLDFFGRSGIFVRMTDEELAAVIGRNVRAARERAGLTQTGLAERSGMAAPHISRLEAGTHLPSVTTLKRVADVLEVPICSLLDPPTGQGHAKAKQGRPRKAKGKAE